MNRQLTSFIQRGGNASRRAVVRGGKGGGREGEIEGGREGGRENRLSSVFPGISGDGVTPDEEDEDEEGAM